MPLPTPAVRAAFVGLVVATVAAVAGAGLHLAAVERDAARSAAHALGAEAEAAAAALTPVADEPARLRDALDERAGEDGAPALALLDAEGRVLSASTDAAAQAARRARRDLAGGAAVLEVGEEAVAVAARPVGGAGVRVAAVRPLGGALPDGVLAETVAAAAAIWAILVALVLAMAWYAGPRTSRELALLGERLAQGGADGRALVRYAGLWLGPLADAFGPVAGRLRRLGAEAQDTREHLAALYQINPHYVVLTTFEGALVEANPAFYAATGLGLSDAGGAEALRERFPVEPLMDLARRSLREGSAITGVEYGLVDRDDAAHPVEVSVRAFNVGETPHALFQATDQAHRKTLESRVAAFHDTLDLMVDQRVEQLTSSQQSLRSVLDAAGVAVAQFDAGGGVTGWSGGAEALTGRGRRSVPHVAAVTSALGLAPDERTAFTQWFWSPVPAPFLARHGVVGADGAPRVRPFVWHRVDAGAPGRPDSRTLVGVEVPAALDALDAGDGRAGAVPTPG